MKIPEQDWDNYEDYLEEVTPRFHFVQPRNNERDEAARERQEQRAAARENKQNQFDR